MQILSFKHFLESLGAGSMISTGWSNSDTSATKMFAGHPVELDGLDFKMGPDGPQIPKVVKAGLVVKFLEKENPIKIELQDGTKLFMSLDQYKNTQGQLPIIPNLTRLTVVFQRLPDDKSLNVSKIVKCIAQFVGNSGQAKQHNIRINSDAMMAQQTF